MAFQLPHDFKSFGSFELNLTKVARSDSCLQIVLDINEMPCFPSPVSLSSHACFDPVSLFSIACVRLRVVPGV